jgi:hypothetical protein
LGSCLYPRLGYPVTEPLEGRLDCLGLRPPFGRDRGMSRQGKGTYRNCL